MEHRSNDARILAAPLTPSAAATLVGHPAGSAHRQPVAAAPRPSVERGDRGFDTEDGSLVTEYGLLAIVAATLAGAVISWASNGAMVTLFNALLRQARALVGA